MVTDPPDPPPLQSPFGELHRVFVPPETPKPRFPPEWIWVGIFTVLAAGGIAWLWVGDWRIPTTAVIVAVLGLVVGAATSAPKK